jgi:hypothetical protein
MFALARHSVFGRPLATRAILRDPTAPLAALLDRWGVGPAPAAADLAARALDTPRGALELLGAAETVAACGRAAAGAHDRVHWAQVRAALGLLFRIDSLVMQELGPALSEVGRWHTHRVNYDINSQHLPQIDPCSFPNRS